MTIETVKTARTFAATRAHRTMVVKMLERGVVNAVAKLALEHAVTLYDAALVDAPAAKVADKKAPADRTSAAFRAHRTMLLRRLTGTRGKVRTELKAKLAQIEAKIAA